MLQAIIPWKETAINASSSYEVLDLGERDIAWKPVKGCMYLASRHFRHYFENNRIEGDANILYLMIDVRFWNPPNSSDIYTYSRPEIDRGFAPRYILHAA